MLAKYKLIALKLIQLGIFSICILLRSEKTWAQKFELPRNRDRISLNFTGIKNLIIIPVMINNKGPFNFILDTGVGPMIITDPSILDSLDFTLLKKITISGLGTDTLTAYVSQNIKTEVGKAKMERVPTAILKEDLFNLSGYLGTKIYGILGYSFFNSFIVDIRYSQNRLIISKKNSKVKFRGLRVPLQIKNSRPYVFAEISLPNGEIVTAKFLVDTGASHALSMEMLNNESFPPPKTKIPAYLGMSLSGRIKGYIGRIDQLRFGGYTFKNIVAGFPDYNTIISKIQNSKRNGNIGGELLRRFDVQIDYADSAMYVKPNGYRKKPFDYDRVGAVVYLDQLKNYKRYVIAEVDDNSPASRGDLLAGDEILAINFKNVDTYSLNDLTELFKTNALRTIIFQIFRNGDTIFRIVRPEDRI